MERNSNFGRSSSVNSSKKEDYLNNAQIFFISPAMSDCDSFFGKDTELRAAQLRV